MLSTQNVSFALNNLIYSIGILFGAVIFRTIASAAIKTILKQLGKNEGLSKRNIEKRAETVGGIIKSLADTAIFGIAFLTILSQWGINIAPILTGAGILGLAVGFGAQTLVKDMVSGFFILFEDQYGVGDRIKAGGFEGKVTEIKLRTTTIVSDNGDVNIIPNSAISTVSHTKA